MTVRNFAHPADKTTRMGDDPTPTTPDLDALGRFSLGRAHRQLRLRGARGERGQALVEFALVLPVLMLLIVGIIKGGLLYNNYLQLTDAVRTGTRDARDRARPGSPVRRRGQPGRSLGRGRARRLRIVDDA